MYIQLVSQYGRSYVVTAKGGITYALLWSLICLPVILGLITQGRFLWRQRKLLSPWARSFVLSHQFPGGLIISQAVYNLVRISGTGDPVVLLSNPLLPTLGSLSHPPQSKLGDCTLVHLWDSHSFEKSFYKAQLWELECVLMLNYTGHFC